MRAGSATTVTEATRSSTKDRPTASGFLAEVVRQWEGATQPARDAGARVCMIRTASSSTSDGGALKLMKLPFKLGVGGRFGDGRQWFPTVSLTDYRAAVTRLATDDSLEGPFNVVAPVQPRTPSSPRRSGTTCTDRRSSRVPAFAVRLGAGELSGEVLGSIRATPRRLDEAGFEFAHPTVETQLAAAFATERSDVRLAQSSRSSDSQRSASRRRSAAARPVPGRLVSWQARRASPSLHRRRHLGQPIDDHQRDADRRVERLARPGPKTTSAPSTRRPRAAGTPATPAGRDAAPTEPASEHLHRARPGRARCQIERSPRARAGQDARPVRSSAESLATSRRLRPSASRLTPPDRRRCSTRRRRAGSHRRAARSQPARQPTRLTCRPRLQPGRDVRTADGRCSGEARDRVIASPCRKSSRKPPKSSTGQRRSGARGHNPIRSSGSEAPERRRTRKELIVETLVCRSRRTGGQARSSRSPPSGSTSGSSSPTEPRGDRREGRRPSSSSPIRTTSIVDSAPTPRWPSARRTSPATGRPGDDTDLADLLTPFAAKLADLVPAPLRRMRAVIDRQASAAYQEHARRRQDRTSRPTTTCRTTCSRPSSTRR